MNAPHVSTASTAELVAFYNANAAKPVAKFADRKTAERRVLQLIADSVIDVAAPAAKDTKPVVRIKLSESADARNGRLADAERKDVRSIGQKIADKESGVNPFKSPTNSASRSEAIALSWTDPTVKASRSERSAVLVAGVQYRSVLQAFQQLNLPLNKHIAFRGQLKAAGTLAFNGLVFKIVVVA